MKMIPKKGAFICTEIDGSRTKTIVAFGTRMVTSLTRAHDNRWQRLRMSLEKSKGKKDEVVFGFAM
ncbi:hypothetical protein TanjilG_28937 [Lupinus angustifolius]|uniref:Uncharacterized protein n=1 Tax=Lupinus angustifolius TaxID=3871 RepID=A0A4P1QXH3_LUPAN|nr:hypothetical protein TanjilG_28937 [Lupinus angustifolius]